MHSAEEQPQVICEYLARECSEGCVLDPLNPMLFPSIQVSHFGVVPKHTPGQWQLIVDMSLPEGYSVDGGIPEPLCSLTYVDAARGILQNSTCSPRQLTGMLLRQGLFVDTALLFGLRSAPKIFTAIAEAAEWIVKQAGVNFLIRYLDDFLVIKAPDFLVIKEPDFLVIKAPDSMPNSSDLLLLTSTFRRLVSQFLKRS